MEILILLEALPILITLHEEHGLAPLLGEVVEHL
jgi:hypothetical protein